MLYIWIIGHNIKFQKYINKHLKAKLSLTLVLLYLNPVLVKTGYFDLWSIALKLIPRRSYLDLFKFYLLVAADLVMNLQILARSRKLYAGSQIFWLKEMAEWNITPKFVTVLDGGQDIIQYIYRKRLFIP